MTSMVSTVEDTMPSTIGAAIRRMTAALHNNPNIASRRSTFSAMLILSFRPVDWASCRENDLGKGSCRAGSPGKAVLSHHTLCQVRAGRRAHTTPDIASVSTLPYGQAATRRQTPAPRPSH